MPNLDALHLWDKCKKHHVMPECSNHYGDDFFVTFFEKLYVSFTSKS